MTSQGPATDRRLGSLVSDVEVGPSDHSSALQLLSLGKPRTLIQQPQPQPLVKLQVKISSVPIATTRTLEQQLLRDSPIATHGRHHKKRRMLEAQAAASTILRENQITQIMVASSNVMDTSEDDIGNNKNNNSHTEA
jgi:hypothetical protein